MPKPAEEAPPIPFKFLKERFSEPLPVKTIPLDSAVPLLVMVKSLVAPSTVFDPSIPKLLALTKNNGLLLVPTIWVVTPVAGLIIT